MSLALPHVALPLAALGLPGEVAVLLALVLANGLLAGAEIAVVSMRASRIEALSAEGRRGARAVRRLRAHPERFLATVQVGITIVGVSAGAFGGARFGPELAGVLERWPPLAPYAESVAFALVVGLITYLTLILGELVPKSLALRRSERYALLVARPLELLATVARPAVWILTRSSNAVLRLFGQHTGFLETRLSPEELHHLVREASEGGALDPGAGEIAERALGLGDLKAGDVMVHRRFVVALPFDAGADELREVFLESGHQRVPVHRGSIDDVVGYVSWRDVLQRVWTGEPLVVAELLRPVHLVPEAQPATHLLRELLVRRQQLAVVVDEHGGVAGIVTLEDLLEELVGEIDSEHDPATRRVFPEDDGSARVLGDATLRDVNRALATALPEPADGTTVNALFVELSGGRIPRVGERFTAADGSVLEVLEASPRRVREARVQPAPRPSAEV